MLVLFETPAGYAVFKLLDEKKLQKTENLFHDFETPEGASKVVKLKQFSKFEDTTEALAAATAAIEGKMSKNLKKMLKKIVAKDAHEQLAVADAKLGNVIKDKLNLSCVANSSIQELMRGIRAQMSSLITGIDQKDISAMALGLAHSLSRYKLKFSPDKVDTMVVQAISLLDDLDKELNNYVMRCREWYGWHFPELSKIIGDHLAFARVVTRMRVRTNAVDTDLSDILPEEVEAAVKSAAEISMGTEISTEDIDNIIHLCEQIIELTDYRTQLYEYLKNRMLAIAPNVTVLLGELVGARLIAHAGSLMNLAKHPASTVQILGAEKALFRALKTKHDTPKYGLIYHASLVGQSSAKLKGKMSRMLAAKSALAIRVDALGEDQTFDIGTEFKAKLELKLREMEQTGPMGVSGLGRKKAQYEKYENKSEIKTYNSGMDSTIPAAAKKRKLEESDTDKTPVKAKRQKSDELEVKEEPGADTDKTPAKAKKRKSTGEVKSESDDSIATSEKKKKKKKKDK
ncbi:PREDICTED: nucleolar protein 58-like isoform X2 [Priapulus caudatus]|uniref:Nucleolar protein 58-like isoform X2 n=1 Tax=Priapulus caudatus TaxID=37621 RepID=A0ABM1F3R9_PRICU|nr:PREDICTED: nucleolar protein 58-like isoform X2 [Priapulus caudatus]